MDYEYYANIAEALPSKLLLESYVVVYHVWQSSSDSIDEEDEVKAYRIELESRLNELN